MLGLGVMVSTIGVRFIIPYTVDHICKFFCVHMVAPDLCCLVIMQLALELLDFPLVMTPDPPIACASWVATTSKLMSVDKPLPCSDRNSSPDEHTLIKSHSVTL